VKYCQTIQTVPNNAVTGHTTFMIHMCCLWRTRSAATTTAHTSPSSRKAIESE